MGFFQNSVLNKHFKVLDKAVVNAAYAKFKEYFHNPEIQNNIREAKEEQFQEGFLRELFVKVLGYTLNPQPNYNLTTELKNEKGAKKADGAILKEGKALVVIELKGTDTKDLDKINTQAFNYKNNQTGCIYVITSNFEKLRFFIHNSVDHLEFNLFTLTEQEFELLWLCLNIDCLLGGIPLKVKEESLLAEENITKQLYKDYAAFRIDLWQNMVKNRADTDQLLLFKKTQKLLDRFLFIFFAEDSGLLPPNSISRIVKRWNVLQEEDAYKPLYDIFNQYFGYINTGRKGKTPQDDIFAYNGGLFFSDEVLDNIVIDDEILQPHVMKLTAYDFQSEIDVNILGHIFENSLNEIENVIAKLEGKEVDKNKTKRKKEGVFYTPKYITKYIVNNTIGKLCEKKKVELNVIDEEYAKGRHNRKKETIKKLDKGLQTYRKWILNITICDPACGSGAFLNQALGFLIAEHAYIDELQSQLLGRSIVFQDVSNHILEKNIYGVDINEESVDIAKLSLWLRTAQKGRKLTTLNNNLKCGNSLIDDPEVAGKKAFNWQNEFPEVFAKGGFDVVIGNPPYGDYFNSMEKSFLLKKYTNSFSGTFDMYIVFYDIALSIVKKSGKLCFITPNTFIDYAQFSGLRNIFIKGNNIEQVIGLTNVFEDAIVDTAIILLTKNENQAAYFKGISFKEEITSLESTDIPSLNSQNLTSSGFILKSSRNFDVRNLINNQPYKLSDLIKITQGITTGGNEFFLNTKSHFLNKGISEDVLKQVLKGKTINRYRVLYDDDYILYSIKSIDKDIQNKVEVLLDSFKEKLSKKRETKQGKLPWYCLHWARDEKDFNKPKILIRQTASHIIGVLDTQNHYPIDTIHTLNLKSEVKDKEKVLKFLLGLLNSKLFKYLYSWKLDEGGKVYPQVKKVNIEWLPIPEYNDSESISSEVDKLQKIILKEEQIRVNFLKYLESKFKSVSKYSGIQNWHELEFGEFINGLNKAIKKIGGEKLSKLDEVDWMEVFDTKKTEAQTLKTEIDKIDKEIDQMVYELYGLTDKETKIVEQE